MACIWLDCPLLSFIFLFLNLTRETPLLCIPKFLHGHTAASLTGTMVHQPSHTLLYVISSRVPLKSLEYGCDLIGPVFQKVYSGWQDLSFESPEQRSQLKGSVRQHMLKHFAAVMCYINQSYFVRTNERLELRISDSTSWPFFLHHVFWQRHLALPFVLVVMLTIKTLKALHHFLRTWY